MARFGRSFPEPHRTKVVLGAGSGGTAGAINSSIALTGVAVGSVNPLSGAGSSAATLSGVAVATVALPPSGASGIGLSGVAVGVASFNIAGARFLTISGSRYRVVV